MALTEQQRKEIADMFKQAQSQSQPEQQPQDVESRIERLRSIAARSGGQEQGEDQSMMGGLASAILPKDEEKADETSRQVLNFAKERGSQLLEGLKRKFTRPEQGSFAASGATSGFLGDLLGTAIIEAIPDETKQNLSERLERFAQTDVGQQALNALQTGQETVDTVVSSVERVDPEMADEMRDLVNTAFAGADLQGISSVGRAGVRAGLRGLDATTDAARAGSRAVTETVSDVAQTPMVSGAGQSARELVERFPRAIQRGSEKLEEASRRKETLRVSSPATQAAIKSELPDRIVNTVQQADEPTLNAYKKIVDIAEDTKEGTLKPEQRPHIVAGEAAAEQFDLIDKQRRAVGAQIGEVAQNLGRDAQVNMDGALQRMEGMLQELGATVDDKGKLSFGAGTNITRAERGKVQELFDGVMEVLEDPTPLNIYKKDQLFSKLQRESRMENLGNIFVNIPGEDAPVSIFRAFRDVFSDTLDTVSPEIKDLNRQYRELRQLVDDVEKSIFRTPNYDVIKTANPAEFAKINLRRVLSEAQSASAYQEIVNQMDELARLLGYEGARPDDLVAFAEAMKDLFPDTVPQTSFRGGIAGGLRGLVETGLSAGAPNIKDQQRALRQLIDEMLTSPTE